MGNGLVDVLPLGDADGDSVNVLVTVNDFGTVVLDGFIKGCGSCFGIIGDDERTRSEGLVLDIGQWRQTIVGHCAALDAVVDVYMWTLYHVLIDCGLLFGP